MHSGETPPEIRRHTELNIGVPSHRIAVDLHTLVGDVRYWTFARS
jgi:hypothetical protein